jgi:hypothetical protein
MPTNRTRRARLWQGKLDDHKIEQMLEGPDRCLLGGVGYIARVFFWNMDNAQKAELLAEMESDWRVHSQSLLAWWINLDARPICSVPWIFPVQGGPGTRPWAWWEFDAPEPLPGDETERAYLKRLNLFVPGEAKLPTREERDAFQAGVVQAQIDVNLRA